MKTFSDYLDRSLEDDAKDFLDLPRANKPAPIGWRQALSPEVIEQLARLQ